MRFGPHFRDHADAPPCDGTCRPLGKARNRKRRCYPPDRASPRQTQCRWASPPLAISRSLPPATPSRRSERLLFEVVLGALAHLGPDLRPDLLGELRVGIKLLLQPGLALLVQWMKLATLHRFE